MLLFGSGRNFHRASGCQLPCSALSLGFVGGKYYEAASADGRLANIRREILQRQAERQESFVDRLVSPLSTPTQEQLAKERAAMDELVSPAARDAMRKHIDALDKSLKYDAPGSATTNQD